ncbi:MAG: hypothetical protein Q9M16_03780 [Mariprofundus sp.]|nr:hypothetical protein [Mariprofundus sp.]
MKNIEEIILLSDAVIDLERGKQFYDKQQAGVGDYFYDSLISDIESLYLYAGIHPSQEGYHYILARRFPFAVYYEVSKDVAIVVAVLDMRSNPAWIHHRLDEREE